MINYKTAFLNEYETEITEENNQTNSHVKILLSKIFIGYGKENL